MLEDSVLNTYIFDITRGSIHDGPGIRTTVFLKGCPLKCLWCHNPESQSFIPQISYNNSLCINCGICEKVCPTHANCMEGTQHRMNIALCTACEACVDACPKSAFTIFGKKMELDSVMETIQKDIPFYISSGGGVTISGGEPLAHGEFSYRLLKRCKELSIHTCVETSGAGKTEILLELSQCTDLFLFDWKISDDAHAIKTIGSDTTVIRKNLDALINNGSSVILRCPIIPEINDTTEHFSSIVSLLKSYPNLKAEILPYHSFGVNKGKHIGFVQESFDTPTKEQQEKWIDYFTKRGFSQVELH